MSAQEQVHRWELQPNGRWSIRVHVYEEFLLVGGKPQVTGYVVDADTPSQPRFDTLDEAIPVAKEASDRIGWKIF